MIGFIERKNAAYLIFPKRLHHKPETKIIGIKYNQIEESAPKGPLFEPSSPGTRTGKPPKTSKPKADAAPKTRPMKKFVAEVEIIARQKISVEVEAGSVAEAKKRLKPKVESLEIDVAQAKIARKVGNVQAQK